MDIFHKLLLKTYTLDIFFLASEFIRIHCIDRVHAITVYTICSGVNLVISTLILKIICSYISEKEKDADSYIDITHPTYNTFECCTLILNIGITIITLVECYLALNLYLT